MTGNKKLWFRARSYGWGWTPITWQGWLCVSLLALYLIAVVTWISQVKPAHSTSNDGLLKSVIGFLLIISGIFVLTGICFAKGERPSWNWGNKKPEGKNDERG